MESGAAAAEGIYPEESSPDLLVVKQVFKPYNPFRPPSNKENSLYRNNYLVQFLY
jgi:hypothetical protein